MAAIGNFMQTPSEQNIRYSIVVPIFNEEAVLPVLLRRLDILLNEQLDGPAEIVFVDDGSTDCSSIVLEAKARLDRRYRYLGLSRNFGHQIAITAGIDRADGEAVVVMDADLQDPPELIGEMLQRYSEGYDVVYAVRRQRHGEGWFKRASAALFYRMLKRVVGVATLVAGPLSLILTFVLGPSAIVPAALTSTSVYAV